MYTPKYAIQTDSQENDRLIRENPFATIVYIENNLPQSFHLPLFLENNRLVGHMARANPAWKRLDGISALFIFHGPHHYISPDFYGTDNNVPTWNYISVQVRGKVSIREDEAFLKKALIDLSRKYDPLFDIEKNILDHDKKLLSIVGIDVEIEEIFGKFKLAQSKPVEERLNVIKALEGINSDNAHGVAEEMRKTL
jgi:transcriptional regulator